MNKYKLSLFLAVLFFALLVIVVATIFLTKRKNIIGEKDLYIDANINARKNSLEIQIINNSKNTITCDLPT